MRMILPVKFGNRRIGIRGVVSKLLFGFALFVTGCDEIIPFVERLERLLR